MGVTACCTSTLGRKRSEDGGGCPGWRAGVGTASPQGSRGLREAGLWGGHVGLDLGPMREDSYTACVWGPLHGGGHRSPPWRGTRASSVGEVGVEVHGLAHLQRRGGVKSHRREALGQRVDYAGSPTAGRCGGCWVSLALRAIPERPLPAWPGKRRLRGCCRSPCCSSGAFSGSRSHRRQAWGASGATLNERRRAIFPPGPDSALSCGNPRRSCSSGAGRPPRS